MKPSWVIMEWINPDAGSLLMICCDVAIVNKNLKVCLYFRTLFQVWGLNFCTFYKIKNILLNSLAKTKHEATKLKFLETVAVIFIVMPFINARSSLKSEDVFTLMDMSPVAEVSKPAETSYRFSSKAKK